MFKYMSKYEIDNFTSFVAAILNARWIVNEDGEMGFRIAGMNFWYYKWTSPHIADYKWKDADKREFGEVVLSVKNVDKMV